MAKKPASPKPATPDTPESAATRAPAPEQTQEHAGAGETQALGRAIETAMVGVAERLEDAANALPPAAPVAVVAFLVRARREGFRRAGRAWSAASTRVEAAWLTADQVAALLAEPMLEVVGVAE